ncbi:MAG: type IV pilus secretin PilQ [Magnetococcus sp. MYC-9]
MEIVTEDAGCAALSEEIGLLQKKKQAGSPGDKPGMPARRMALGLATGGLLLGSVVLGGCLTVQGVATDSAGVAAPVSGQAEGATVVARLLSSVDLLETGQGVRVSLGSDGTLPYQIFSLEDPPRLLLTFPGVRLDQALQPRQVDVAGIRGVYPMEGEDRSARLEIVLQGMVGYSVRERPDGLDLTLLSKAGDAPAAGGALLGQSPHIESIQLANNASGTHIHVRGVGNIPEPQSLRLQDPPQLILDFPGVSGPTSSRDWSVNSQEVTNVRLASEAQKTRLVVELTSPQVHARLDRDESLPVVHLTRKTGEKSTLTPAQVQSVAFTQSGSTSLITIQTNSDALLLDSRREEKLLVVTLKESRLAERLSHQGSGGQRQDVQGFGGPVKTIDTYMEGPDTQVVVTLGSAADRHEIIQQGKSILLQIKPPATTESGLGPPVYTGAKVSMDFKEIHIHNALRVLAELNHLNLLVSDSVKGTVTMRLVEVPWDQALDLILETKGLSKVLQGNVLRVAPMAELQNMADAKLQAHESRQTLEPIVTEMIPISFAKATEIRDLLLDNDQRGPAGGAAGRSAGQGAATAAGGAPVRDALRNPRLLSASGSLSVDQRTNTLIVKDMAANLAKIRELVAKLDKPIPQVMIEARIVEIVRDSTLGLGINWGLNYKGSVDAPLGISNTAANAYLVQQNNTVQAARRPTMTGSAPNFNLGGQLPSGVSSNLGIHLGSLSPLLDLDIELGALETNGKAKTISSPRILTANNKEASISQGVRQPYPTEALSGGVTYQYIDAALSLKVTPHVTANGFITLDVNAKNNSIQGSVAAGAPPALSTREVETQALVKDGQTIVLGGILQNNQIENNRGIPELKDIPGLGWLFKNRLSTNNQTELMVFITPRIVNP